MNIFLCILLLPFVTCSVQKVENIELLSKRGFDHNSNLALLNSLNFDNTKSVGSITSPTPTPIVNVGNPDPGTIPVTINTENLALGNPNPIQNGLQFAYAPSYPQNQPSVENNVIYLTGEKTDSSSLPYVNLLTSGLPLVGTANFQNGAVHNIQDNRNFIQSYIPQNVVEVPQTYPVQVIREVKVPQPYPVHITRTVQIPVEVRVPVEVPKPYPVKIPHPVPVPVHIRVPVTVEKPYPVQITKTVAVPVEKPVYIKVPQPIQVPVPQPYPVGVPQPIQVQVPFVVRLPEVAGPVPPHLEGTQANLVPSVPLGAQFPVTPTLPELNLNPVTPATTCGACSNGTLTSPKPSLESVTGSGLLPPHPPSDTDPKPKAEEGLLSSYVSSNEGGVYRRGTEYQTNEYKKTW